jgi:hypothetical protein
MSISTPPPVLAPTAVVDATAATIAGNTPPPPPVIAGEEEGGGGVPLERCSTMEAIAGPRTGGSVPGVVVPETAGTAVPVPGIAGAAVFAGPAVAAVAVEVPVAAGPVCSSTSSSPRSISMSLSCREVCRQYNDIMTWRHCFTERHLPETVHSSTAYVVRSPCCMASIILLQVNVSDKLRNSSILWTPKAVKVLQISECHHVPLTTPRSTTSRPRALLYCL